MRNEVSSIIKSMIQGLNGIGVQVANIYRQNADTMIRGLQIDFVHFILYLADADGEITDSENKFIKEYFDMDLTIDNWKEYIDDLDFDIKQPKLPMTFEFFIKADNVQYSNDRNVGNACESYISCFKAVGEVFLGADGEVSEEEVKKLTAFIDLMQNFYEKNTDRINVNKPETVDIEFAKKVASPKKELKNGEVVVDKPISRSCKSFAVRFLDKAIEQSKDSIGSASNENEIFRQSIQGLKNEFENQFQMLSNEVISSDWIKDLISAGTDFLGVLTDIVKQDDLVSGTIGIITEALKQFASILKSITGNDGVASLIKGFMTFKTITKGIDFFNFLSGKKNTFNQTQNAMNAFFQSAMNGTMQLKNGFLQVGEAEKQMFSNKSSSGFGRLNKSGVS